MRLSPRRPLLPCLLLLLPTVNAISLADFQPINGFSDQCTQAYNTQLQGCSQSDFHNGGSHCSTECIAYLTALTKILNQDCAGTSALPNTLMGLFFIQRGTATLCPNVLGSSSNSGQLTVGEQYTTVAKPSSETSTPSPSPAASSETTPSASPTQNEASAAPSSSETPQPSASPQTSAASPVAGGNASQATQAASSAGGNQASAPPNAGVASTQSGGSTSSSPSSSSTSTAASTGRAGGGGTILDVGSSAPPNARIGTGAVLSIFGILGGFLFL